MFIAALRFVRRLGSACAAVFLLSVYSAAYAETSLVTIVQSEDGGSYAEFSNALHTLLSVKGITHAVIDSSSPLPDSGLVIGVGMKAATAVAASDAPSVLNVLIPKAGQEKLLRDFPRRAASHTFSAIVLDQPVYRQIRLITALLPDRHNIGLLYSSPPAELARLRQELGDRGLSLHARALVPAFPLMDALQEILRNSEVLLALPDAAVYNSSTLRNILLTTYRSGVPLIGFSPGYVKAGALGAVFTTPAQIATQAAALIRQFGETRSLPPVQYPHEFEVMVNEQVARSLGFPIRDASLLHGEISTEHGGEP